MCATAGSPLWLPSHTFPLDGTKQLYLCQLNSDWKKCSPTLPTSQPSPGTILEKLLLFGFLILEEYITQALLQQVSKLNRNYTMLSQRHVMIQQDTRFETLWQDGLSFRAPSSDSHLNILILERKITSTVCNHISSDASHISKPIVLKGKPEAILKTDFGWRFSATTSSQKAVQMSSDTGTWSSWLWPKW